MVCYTSKKLKILQMRRSNLFILKTFRPLLLATFTILTLGYNVRANAQDIDGGKLFSQYCGTCHFPDKDMTGPALQGARDRWIANSSEENFYAWVMNSGAVIASGDAYANELFTKWKKVAMPAQPVKKEQIDAIFDYVEAYTPPAAATDTATGTGDPNQPGESSSMIWWIIASLLIIVIFTVGGVKGQLANIVRRQEGEAELPQESVMQSARRWAWENRGWFGVLCLIIVIILLVAGMWDLMRIGVYENYKPEQPIAYSHKLHAGDLGIDCKYCHHQVTKSQHAGIPSVNVCMNCHKTVNEGSSTGTTEIAKIYEAAGWDPENKVYTGVEKPIEWVKVHDLPDHVYFNHSQHVVVGGLDCKACHGDMKLETVARVMTTEDLNNVGTRPGDKDRGVEPNGIKFTRPTLTMGWCIECHQQSSIDIAGAAGTNPDSYYGVIHNRLLTNKKTYQSYLEDDIVTVAELGGMECAKCHY
jgi:mono/diheme cytochrome c family protein